MEGTNSIIRILSLYFAKFLDDEVLFAANAFDLVNGASSAKLTSRIKAAIGLTEFGDVIPVAVELSLRVIGGSLPLLAVAALDPDEILAETKLSN